MGAVMVTAALNSMNDSNDHPCVQSPFVLWWGEKINNWRDCFEALTSGDFLSADFFATRAKNPTRVLVDRSMLRA